MLPPGPGGRVRLPLRLAWHADGIYLGSNVSFIFVVQNSVTNNGFHYGAVLSDDTPIPSTLSPDGVLDVNVRLLSSAVPASDYSAFVVLTTANGGWEGRFARSPALNFSIVHQTEVPTQSPTGAPTCAVSGTDVAFLVDRSGDVTQTELTSFRSFMKSTAQLLPSNSRIAIISYNSYVSTEMLFTSNQTSLAIDAVVDSIASPAGSRNTSAGLLAVIELFSESNGARSVIVAPRLVVVMIGQVSGESEQSISAAADSLRSSTRATVFAVGLNAGDTTLGAIAGPNGRTISGDLALTSSTSAIVTHVCTARVPQWTSQISCIPLASSTSTKVLGFRDADCLVGLEYLRAALRTCAPAVSGQEPEPIRCSDHALVNVTNNGLLDMGCTSSSSNSAILNAMLNAYDGLSPRDEVQCHPTSDFLFVSETAVGSCEATASRINAAIAALSLGGGEFDMCGITPRVSSTTAQTSTRSETTPTETSTTDTFQGRFECVDQVRTFGAPVSLIAISSGGVCRSQVDVLNALLSDCGSVHAAQSPLLSCGTAPVLSGRTVINGGCRTSFAAEAAINNALRLYNREIITSQLGPVSVDEVFCGFETDFVQVATQNCSRVVATINAAVEARRSGVLYDCDITSPTTTATSTATSTATTDSQSRWDCFNDDAGTGGSYLVTASENDCTRNIDVLNLVANACSNTPLSTQFTCAVLPRLNGYFVNSSCTDTQGSEATSTLGRAVNHFQQVSNVGSYLPSAQPACSDTSDLVTLGASATCNDRAALLNRATRAFLAGEWAPCLPEVQVVHMPQVLLRSPTHSTWAGPIRVQWRAQGPQTGINVSMILVVQNNRTSDGLYFGSRVAGTNEDLHNLPSAGTIDIEILLSTAAEVASGYSISVVLVPSGGFWTDRFARSEQATFSVQTLATSGQINVFTLSPVVPTHLCGGRPIIAMTANYSADANVTLRVVVRSLSRSGGVVSSVRIQGSSSQANLAPIGQIGVQVVFGGWVQDGSYGTRFSVQLFLTDTSGSWENRFASSAIREFDLSRLTNDNSITSSVLFSYVPSTVTRSLGVRDVTFLIAASFTSNRSVTFGAIARPVDNQSGPNRVSGVRILGETSSTVVTACGSIVLEVTLESSAPSGRNYSLELYMTAPSGLLADRYAVSTPSLFEFVGESGLSDARITSIPPVVVRPAGSDVYFGPITVVYAIDPHVSISNVTIIPVIRNSRTNVGLVLGSRIVGTQDLPSNLLPVGSVTLELLLGSTAEASSTYSAQFAISPRDGDLVDQFVLSSAVTFSVLDSTTGPSQHPTEQPPTSASPSHVPTQIPTLAIQTESPTSVPTALPTFRPSANPTSIPTLSPTASPTQHPSNMPTEIPSSPPTTTESPSSVPTALPTFGPSANPTPRPTDHPTDTPTSHPTNVPISAPTASDSPTADPTNTPTVPPSSRPTSAPTSIPTFPPTAVPSVPPTPVLSSEPTLQPSTTGPTTSCPPLSVATNFAEFYPADSEVYASALNPNLHLNGSFRFPPIGQYDFTQGRSQFISDCASACCENTACSFFTVHVATISPPVYGCYLLADSGGVVGTTETMYSYSMALIVNSTAGSNRDYCHNGCESTGFRVLPSGGRCHCDSFCLSENTCCPDYLDLCTGTPPGSAGAVGTGRIEDSNAGGINDNDREADRSRTSLLVVVAVVLVSSVAGFMVVRRRNTSLRANKVEVVNASLQQEENAERPPPPRVAFGIVSESTL